MPNTVQAAAEGMPVSKKITRRVALCGIATLPALGGATGALAAIPAPAQPDADLLALIAECEGAAAKLRQAEADLEWLVDEWRHLWPLAPEKILGGANMEHTPSAERDIAGRLLYRETATLTWRLAPKFRARGKTCFGIYTAEELFERLASWRARKSKTRTPNGVKRDMRLKAKYIAEYEEQHALALLYEAETTRLRDLSGVAKLHDKIGEAKAALNAIEARVMMMPAKTVAGVVAKANVYVTSPNSEFMQRLSRNDAGNCLTGGCWRLAQEIAQLAGAQS